MGTAGLKSRKRSQELNTDVSMLRSVASIYLDKKNRDEENLDECVEESRGHHARR